MEKGNVNGKDLFVNIAVSSHRVERSAALLMQDRQLFATRGMAAKGIMG